jgi:hypothetical protein
MKLEINSPAKILKYRARPLQRGMTLAIPVGRSLAS